MKKLLFPLAVAVLLSSACSPLFYQQIATLTSENVSMKDNGSFAYEDGVMTIEYDFWSEAGEFTFVVNNNSDDDIYLNLAESYFVNNGQAKDYFQDRTYEYVDGEMTVKVAEKDLVCIPAHSYKVFEEFEVSSTPFRECGFPRDPSKGKDVVKEFTGYNSPRVIENRLQFEIGEVTIPVTNVFYVSQYHNVLSSEIFENVKVERCDGRSRYVRVNKYSGNNKFYLIYTSSDLSTPEGLENDRTNKSFKKSFRDGIYSK
jgi:hypothetical protein